MNAKVRLGTSWGFVARGGGVWTVEGGLPKGVRAYRIAPSQFEAGRFAIDVKPVLGPWEDFASGTTFGSPEDAAAFLVTKAIGVVGC